jgi:septum formation protein
MAEVGKGRMPELVLASASPRRLQLLRDLGLDPRVVTPSIDEAPLPLETAHAYVSRLAEAKARAVAGRLAARGHRSVVLAADTEVILDDRPLGKPRDAAHAADMLRALSGRVHVVMTGVFLLRTDDGRSVGEAERTRVTFHAYDDRTIREYVATGEPLDKAGAYGIQGHGSRLVRDVDGSWTNVVGLPSERIGSWLARIGIDLDSLVRR